MMYVPIRHGWKQVGILSIQSYKPNAYTESDLERLQALANHCAGAMERIRALTEWKRLEREILHISAREQRRIGHDLHDGLGQFLGGVAFQAKLLEDSLASEKSTHLPAAKQVVRLLNNAIRQTRTLALGLDPIALAAHGLSSALHRLADDTRSVFRINCSAKIEAGFEPVDANASHQLYRIAQEAVTNAVQHGQARHVQLQLGFKAGQLCLTIRDDGRGFGPEKKKDAGMGLRIMEYRARSLGGLVKISSKPKQGTEVRCVVPKILMSAPSAQAPVPAELPRAVPRSPRPRA
jgi:signal transduction histidine kinase